MALSSDNWIGIDLGTYNSSAAIMTRQGTVEIIKSLDKSTDAEGQEKTKEFPSFISFNRNGDIEDVGAGSKEKAQDQPESVVWGIKRLIGKTFTDLKQSGELDRFPYKIRPDRVNGQCIVSVADKSYTPVQLCAEIMKKIKNTAERQADAGIDSVVVSVPAYYDPLRVTPIVEAARLAGFVNIKTIPEPVAAALAYKFDITVKPINTLVFDLGAGTLDVTAGYLYRHPAQPDECGFEVLKNTGDPKLGGMDFDDRILKLMVDRCGIGNLTAEDTSRLRRIAEMTKIRLSDELEVQQIFKLRGKKHAVRINQLDLRFALEGAGAEKNLLEECRDQVMAAIDEAKWSPNDVDLIILIGGPTRLPCIKDVLKVVFYSKPEILRQMEEFYSGSEKVDRMTAVSVGAAASAERNVDDKVPYGHGIEDCIYSENLLTKQPEMLIPRDCPYPYMSSYYSIGWMMRTGLYEIKIIQQVPKSEIDQLGYEYRFMGIQKFAVKNPNLCKVIVQMGYNANKELVVTIRNLYTNEVVTYIGMNQYACVGMHYPFNETLAPQIFGSVVKKVRPANEILNEFYQWAQATAGFIRRKAENYMLPQMIIRQILDELEQLFKMGAQGSDYEEVYTKLNSLFWNANSRGLLVNKEYNELLDKLLSFENKLFIIGRE